MGWKKELSAMSKDEVLTMSKKYSALSTQFYGLNFLQESAFGSRVMDRCGKEVIDFTSGIGWYNVGHNNPRLNNVEISFLKKNTANLPDHDWPHGFAALLKKKLAEATPGNFEKKVFLARGGTEALEHARKICLANKGIYSNGKLFVFNKAFHGRSAGSLELNQSKEVHWKGFIDPLSRATAIPFPEMSSDHDCVWYLETIVNEIKIIDAGTLSHFNPIALFFEPVQGEGGINVPCYSCLKKVISIFRDAGAIIVADEVQTGMMRTGKMFACEHLGIEPDIICLGKSLSPGFHLSAAIYRSGLDFTVGGRNSNTGVNPKACAVALEMFDVLEELDKTKLERKINKLSTIAPEGLGFMRRVICKTKEERDEKVLMAAAAEPAGLLLLGAGERNIRLMPPVNISDKDLDEGMNIFRSIM